MGHRHDKEWMFTVARAMRVESAPPDSKPMQEPQELQNPPLSPTERLVLVFENAWILTVMSLIIGFTGVFIDGRWFVLLCIPIAFGLHRSKGLQGLRWWVQIGFYFLIIGISATICWKVGLGINGSREHIPTVKEIGDYVLGKMPEKETLPRSSGETRPTPLETRPTLKPIIARDFSTLISLPSGTGTFWLALRDRKTLCKSDVAIHMYLVNTDPQRKNMIRDIEVEEQTGKDRWVQLSRFPIGWGDLFYGFDLKNLSQVNTSTLDSRLIEHTFDPGGVMEGWIVAEYPRDIAFPGPMRIVISDFSGVKSISDATTQPARGSNHGAITGGTIGFVGRPFDMSSYKVRYCSEITQHQQ
jgi:hypothetical protein